MWNAPQHAFVHFKLQNGKEKGRKKEERKNETLPTLSIHLKLLTGSIKCIEEGRPGSPV